MTRDVAADFAERLRSSGPSNLILTGEINSGKSRFLESIVDGMALGGDGLKVGGFVSRGLFYDGKKVGYLGIDCLSGTTSLMTFKVGLSAEAEKRLRHEYGKDASSSVGQAIGSWCVFDSGVAFASEAIRNAVALPCDLIVADEFGPLECEGKGLRLAVDAAITARIPVLLVVRRPLVRQVQAIYGNFEVVEVPAEFAGIP